MIDNSIRAKRETRIAWWPLDIVGDLCDVAPELGLLDGHTIPPDTSPPEQGPNPLADARGYASVAAYAIRDGRKLPGVSAQPEVLRGRIPHAIAVAQLCRPAEQRVNYLAGERYVDISPETRALALRLAGDKESINCPGPAHLRLRRDVHDLRRRSAIMERQRAARAHVRGWQL
jgi:hypothetical protein